MNSDEAHRRAEALFKKEQQSREAQPATAEYDAEQSVRGAPDDSVAANEVVRLRNGHAREAGSPNA